MSIPELLIIGLGLSMDAFAVTISDLLAYPNTALPRNFLLPVTFGVFQGLMLAIGFFAGSFALDYIESFAGPLALVILAAIGGKMIIEAFKAMRVKHRQDDSAEPPGNANSAHKAPTDASSAHKTPVLTLPVILIQAVATAIDALMVGVSLAALGVSILLAAPLIGIVTFLICLLGLVIGRHFGQLLGDRAQVVGGIILILIGIRACFFG